MDYGKTKICLFDVVTNTIHNRKGRSMDIWLPQWDAVAKGAPVQKWELTTLRDMVTKGDHIRKVRINAGDSLFTQARQLLYFVQEIKAEYRCRLELVIAGSLDDLLEASQDDLLYILLTHSFDVIMSSADGKEYTQDNIRERCDQLDFWCGCISMF